MIRNTRITAQQRKESPNEGDERGEPSFAVLKATLAGVECILAEPGALIAHRNLRMDTGMPSGGFLWEMRRLLVAESFFINTFSAEQNSGEVYLAPSVPGDIKAHPLAPHGRC